MAQKNPTRILKNFLNHLSVDNFNDFCDALLDRREEPCVPRVRVEGKSRLEIGNVMISTFTEQGALKVAEEILREIDCSEAANKLAKEAGPAGPAGGAGPGGPAGGAGPGGPAGGAMEHFVDVHMEDLVQRVSCVDPILDALLIKKVIQPEAYDTIRALPTSQNKMRELYKGPFRSSNTCKDIFLEILRKQQPYLIADLENK